eukprot:58086-Lingulodinium_polyedra.AAC.1
MASGAAMDAADSSGVAPSTPPPSRSRRLRSACTKRRFWRRTRWSILAEEEEENEGFGASPL